MSPWDLRQQRDLALSLLPRLQDARIQLLPQEDEAIRRELSQWGQEVWPAMPWETRSPANWWTGWKPWVEAQPELLLIMACAPGAYARARACQELAQRPSPLALALLLLRSNDWSPEVRDVARTGLQAFFTPAYAAWWVDASPLVLRFDQEVRAPFDDLRPQVRALLNTSEAAPAVQQGWASLQPATRLGLLDLLGVDGLAPALRSQLVKDPDARVRRAFLPLANERELHQFSADPVASLRAAALTRVLPSLCPGTETPEFRTALLDTHGSVRWQVQYALRQIGQDPRAVYLGLSEEELSFTEHLGFLGGLADVRIADDLERVWPYTASHRPPRHRAEAVRTIGALDPTQATAFLWSQLLQRGQMARQAERVLLRQGLVMERRLQEFWLAATEQRQQRVAFRLALRLDRFTAAALLLEWRRSTPLLHREMDAWVSRLLGGFQQTFYTRPTPEIRQRLFAAVGAELPQTLVRQVQALG